MAESAHQLETEGKTFILKDFLRKFNDAGNIPVELVRWEITGAKTITK